MSNCYYACFAREDREIDGRQRIGLEFEIVREECLALFFSGDKTRGGKRQRVEDVSDGEKLEGVRGHEEVLESFLRYGLTDERFLSRKGRYLGNTGFQLLTVYFEDISYARYRYGNWYFIELTDREHMEELTGKVHDCAVYEWGEVGDPVINAYGSFLPLGREEMRALRQLYDPYIPPESLWNGNQFAAIGGATVFQTVRFYYVGAALCAGILDNLNNLVAFFDLGTRVSNNPFIINQQAAAQNSQNAIQAELGNIGPGNPVTIFISHWHADHCNALDAFFQNGALAANIAQNTEWYVPGSALPSFHRVQNAVPAVSFHVVAAGMAQAPVNINGNVNIQAGKINYAGHLHPHHQSVYARVMLASGTTVLLAGDATYAGIPLHVRTNGPAGYVCLQASHHGGNYHYAPAAPNPPMTYIPDAANGAIAVYSADGIRHGHPSMLVMNEHRGRGYFQGNERQLNQGAAMGFNILDVF